MKWNDLQKKMDQSVNDVHIIETVKTGDTSKKVSLKKSHWILIGTVLGVIVLGALAWWYLLFNNKPEPIVIDPETKKTVDFLEANPPEYITNENAKIIMDNVKPVPLSPDDVDEINDFFKSN